MTHQEPDKQWHLDKRVPVALIFALLVQTAGAFWWAASIQERVNTQANLIREAAQERQRLETRLEQIKSFSQSQAINLAEIGQQIVGMREDISDLVRVLRARNGRE